MRQARTMAGALTLCGILFSGSILKSDVLVENTEFPIRLDGRFTEDRAGARNEWSDVAALAFISAGGREGRIVHVPPGVPEANCLAAVVSKIQDQRTGFLWMVFAFEERTVVDNGVQEVANFRFPYRFGTRSFETSRLTLQTVSDGRNTRFTFGFDLTDNGIINGAPTSFGIEAAAGIGPSPLSESPHLVVEIRLPLLPEGIAAGDDEVRGTERETSVRGESVPDERDLPQIGPPIILRVGNDDSVTSATLVRSPAEFPEFRRGDSNLSGTVDMADPIFTLSCLFLGMSCSACPDAADANDDSAVDLSDGVFTLCFLFLGGPPLPTPGPSVCGFDPTDLGTLGTCEYDCD